MADDQAARLQVIKDLTELIEAIDRRLPRLGHLDEPAIADEAAKLRARAADFRERLNDSVAKLRTPGDVGKASSG